MTTSSMSFTRVLSSVASSVERAWAGNAGRTASAASMIVLSMLSACFGLQSYGERLCGAILIN